MNNQNKIYRVPGSFTPVYDSIFSKGNVVKMAPGNSKPTLGTVSNFPNLNKDLLKRHVESPNENLAEPIHPEATVFSFQDKKEVGKYVQSIVDVFPQVDQFYFYGTFDNEPKTLWKWTINVQDTSDSKARLASSVTADNLSAKFA